MKSFNDYQNLKILSELGLEEKEALIYLAALETGGGTISELAQYCHVERTGIYYHLKKLLDQKLLKVATRGKRTFYLPADPDRLRKIFEHKQAKFYEILPAMEEKFSRETSKSIIKYYEGAEEVDHFYKHVYELLRELKPEVNTIYVLGSSYHTVLESNSDFANFQKPLDKINICTKAILPISQRSKSPKDLEDHPYIVSRYNLPAAELKYIKDKYQYPGSMVVTEKHVIMYDWRNLIFSITENKNSATTWRMFFELIWDNLK